MPGFDGTGPSGQGPMTGQGRGLCVLNSSEEDPSKLKGFAGVNGKPVESFRYPGKEVSEMPRGDGTGPAGMGPVTGRVAGFCAGYPVPCYMNPVVGKAGLYGSGLPIFARYGVPYGGWTNPWVRRGFGRGLGRGWGRGRGRFGYWW